ncbi:MAG TPA: tetratricopeptide repeat protein [Armatimonadota bacterium]|jgi:tetratricopeptide (TPR) repeat protein
MNRQRGKQVLGWVMVVVLLVVIQPLAKLVDYNRTVLGMKSPTSITRIVDFDPTAISGVVMGAALGGFQGVAASMLWIKMEELWDSGKGTWLACMQVMRDVTLLDPHWLEPWKILGWHLAYNLYVETKDPAQQAIYLAKGLDILKEGISWNPDTYELYTELGWTYFDKVRDYENATKWFRAALQFPHPEYIERMIAHAYERMPDLDRALDWYDYCLKRYPNDETAKGATTTLRLRYLPAWRLMQAGQYDAAIAKIDDYLTAEPNGMIALHIKAHIYEQAGRDDKALEVWTLAARLSAMDVEAKRKVAELSAKLGRPLSAQELAPSFLLEQKEKAIPLAVPQHAKD